MAERFQQKKDRFSNLGEFWDDQESGRTKNQSVVFAIIAAVMGIILLLLYELEKERQKYLESDVDSSQASDNLEVDIKENCIGASKRAMSSSSKESVSCKKRKMHVIDRTLSFGRHSPTNHSEDIERKPWRETMPEYCVTGGTGFIASYLVRELLLRGHQVRATVRGPGDEEKVGFLWSMDGAKERLRLVKADLLVEGSFDEALDGVDGVFHTASPVFTHGNILESLIDPAIKGTMNVLKSCAKFSSVKRVVLTSSCSAIRYREDSTLISPLNESHWSDTEYCKRYNLWYAYAKTLAEKEAFRLAEQYVIDLVAVNPSYVVGPLLAPHPTSTLQMILSIMKGDYALYPNTTIGFVHIDDVVSAHILAMEDGRASGRLICSSSVAHWSEIIQMLRAKYPSYPIPTKCDEKEGDSNPHSMSTRKVEELGLKYFKTITQMFDDCIHSFQEKGLL